jgi:ATP-binding cassette, subfamily B, heavy metal transporter
MENSGKPKTSKREIWSFVKPYFNSPESKMVLRVAMTAMLVSKLLAVGSPYCLKIAVNALSASEGVNMTMAYYGIAGFGCCRALSSFLHEWRNNLMTQYLRNGIKKLSETVFAHVHSLDLLYHKTSTKNTLFAVNKAMDSIENSIRFIAGFITPLALEFSLISGLIGVYFGPMYLLNTWGMLGIYTVFTRLYSKSR